MDFSTKNSLTTLFQTFIMGSIDAYTFQNFNGSFVSAQTGNLVVFAYELAAKGWQTAYVRVPVLIGFLLGAFISQACKHLKLSTNHRFSAFLLLSILFLGLLYGAMFTSITELPMLFSLGLFSGYELTVFNKIGGTSVNNGIMTGNLKNFSNNVYEAIFSHDHDALIKAGHFLSGICMFVFGILFSTYYLKATGTRVFLCALLINTILLIIVTIFKEAPSQPQD
ncbi:YoaK family protein [Lentilactobacillus raoultii]|uniref:YoaK family protein n=1 Tax=Lentilactobacillus raoultii TaxID=1987503 RepID=A0ABW3PN20_9LACO|nr:YoaK family protein [Lentilactobacillus raoultii]